jgi:hypothetical protein
LFKLGTKDIEILNNDFKKRIEELFRKKLKSSFFIKKY